MSKNSFYMDFKYLRADPYFIFQLKFLRKLCKPFSTSWIWVYIKVCDICWLSKFYPTMKQYITNYPMTVLLESFVIIYIVIVVQVVRTLDL